MIDVVPFLCTQNECSSTMVGLVSMPVERMLSPFVSSNPQKDAKENHYTGFSCMVLHCDTNHALFI